MIIGVIYPLGEHHDVRAIPHLPVYFWQAMARSTSCHAKHYAVRAKSNDQVIVKGWLDVKIAWLMRIMSNLLGVLVPYNGNKVPVSVTFTSTKDGYFHFDRTFKFPDKSPHHFQSKMQALVFIDSFVKINL